VIYGAFEIDSDFTCTPVGAEFTIADPQLLIAYPVHLVSTTSSDPGLTDVDHLGEVDATPLSQPAQWKIQFATTDHPAHGRSPPAWLP
jgi:hypothetical protein